ncbi:STAS domain-containing protein [Actinokineospora iranica]|uniref:Anti-sigma factor antagonist n=1 Tax=Actinokineospora iranica TaxID=1271860 RepID=A0A1G6XED3_9PSEU|nr:STAS domain-containing protein [Actinokineospora iranica]SDD76441.1 anti-anti-sigma factor [Actinokineospora iranica]
MVVEPRPSDSVHNRLIPTQRLARPHPLRVRTVRPRNGTVVVHVAGDIDAASAPPLWSLLEHQLRSSPALVVLDLAEVAFADTAALETLILARRQAEGQGVALRLVAPAPSVTRLLDLGGRDAPFTCHPDIDTALNEADLDDSADLDDTARAPVS